MDANTYLESLLAERDRINAELAKAKNAEKIMKKLQNTKLHARTAHKYYDLQALYVETTKVNLGV